MSKRPAISNPKIDGLLQKPRKEQASMLNFFAADSSGNKNGITADPGGARISETKQKFTIFCDLDGVLVDFNEGVKRQNNGKGVHVLSSKQMWRSIALADKFFLNLPWTQDGKTLWNRIVENGYYPNILTGVPFIKGSKEHKFDWCQKELKCAFENQGKTVIFNHVDYASPKNKHERNSGSIRKGKNIVNVITCWSQNKHFESGAGKVLIDDREDLGHKWTAMGGIFIHHVTAERSIAAMEEQGILVKEATLASKRIRKDDDDDDAESAEEKKNDVQSEKSADATQHDDDADDDDEEEEVIIIED